MSERAKIKVLIVDDSLVYRTAIQAVLSADKDIDVVAQATNGKTAIPRLKHHQPDFIILDQEMPEMNGIELLETMRRDFPNVGVLMFSSHTIEGAKITLRALELGALDFVAKPASLGNSNIEEYIRTSILTKIKSLSTGRILDHLAGQFQKESREESKKVTLASGGEPVAGSLSMCSIGISTGGPVALRVLLPLLPENLKGSITIVQHMPPLFTKQLAESLNSTCKIKVVEGEDGMIVEPATAYIAPGGLQMMLAKENDTVKIRVKDSEPELNCKPSVNILFRSAAEVYGAKSLGVIMTGMGSDGHEGMKLMKSKGAYLLAQDEASSLVWGMPSGPTKDGLISELLDIPGLAVKITRLLGTS